jgi:hypothetical protein
MLPKKIELLLLESTPFGLRYADIKNKTIRAFISPRASFKELLKRPELNNSGVYVLFNKYSDSGLPQAYIGEADILSFRLPMHNNKDFWSEIIVFVAKDETLDKAGVRYIESMLVSRARQDKLADLENGNIPAIKNLSEANIAVMDEFIEDIILLLSVLGYSLIRSKDVESDKAYPLLFIDSIGQKAKGRETDEGFVVYEGSTARPKEVESVAKWERSIKTLKETLIKNGVLSLDPETGNYVFMQDYVFSSPSASAGLILGRSSNGRTEWKDKNGKTLKEIQEIK